MTRPPAVTVASVLLLSTRARQRQVLPWLRVVGEPVGYVVEALELDELPELGRSWDVIVVDGVSCASERQRAAVLRRATHAPHCFAMTIYLAHGARDATEAAVLAGDVVLAGPDQGERLRRRVQGVALAPWRRSLALRLEAERLGPQRLRLVRPDVAPANTVRDDEAVTRRSVRLDRSLPFLLLQRAAVLGAEAQKLVAHAFHEGRRVGVATVQEKAERVCSALAEEIELGRHGLRPEDVADMEAEYRDAPGSPVVAARFGGASAVLTAVRAELGRHAQDELATIDRQRALAPEL